jgi:polysaccharide biosynthesis protein PslE
MLRGSSLRLALALRLLILSNHDERIITTFRGDAPPLSLLGTKELDTMQTSKTTISPRQICHLLFRQKRKIAIFFAVVMVLASAIIVLMPRSYRSQAKLLVRLGRENAALDPTASFGQAPVVAVPPTRENDINSALEILTSRILLEKVVAAVGANAILGRAPIAAGAAQEVDDDTRQAAFVKLSRKLEVEAGKKSNIITISYDGPSAEVAEAVVSHLIESYLERYAHLHRTPGAYGFLAEQTERMHAELTRTEEELSRRKEETLLFAPEGQRQALVAQIAVIDGDLLKATAEKAAVEAEVKALHERLDALPRTEMSSLVQAMPTQSYESLRTQLFTLYQKELDLLARLGPDHADVRLVRGQIAAARESIKRQGEGRDQVTMGPSRLYEESRIALLKQEVLLASLQARIQTLRRQSEQQHAAVQALSRGEVVVLRLQRDVELQTLQYRKYIESREQAEIDRGLEEKRISNISIVQPATRDADPVRPRPLLYLGLAFVIAVVGSLALAVISENLDGSLKSPQEAESVLGLPVLAFLPYQHRQAAAGGETSR